MEAGTYLENQLHLQNYDLGDNLVILKALHLWQNRTNLYHSMSYSECHMWILVVTSGNNQH